MQASFCVLGRRASVEDAEPHTDGGFQWNPDERCGQASIHWSMAHWESQVQTDRKRTLCEMSCQTAAWGSMLQTTFFLFYFIASEAAKSGLSIVSGFSILQTGWAKRSWGEDGVDGCVFLWASGSLSAALHRKITSVAKVHTESGNVDFANISP